MKDYGSFRAVENLDLDVERGDFLAFLGPNGAGKTTTIHCVTGLCRYASGSIRVMGHDVTTDYRSARRRIGLCPQEFNFDPFLSIEGILVYQAGYFGIGRADATVRARRLLDRFRLSDKKDQDFRKLSGGMKRRLLLCRALVHDPDILILDEPTAGADIELKYQIWDFLREINSAGKTIFLTTHYMEEAERLSRTVVVLHRGRILHRGSTPDFHGDKDLETRYLELVREAEAEP
ncbi:MAG: putative ABC transporter ATP-binding protein YadG [Candidatus Omnitrophica bacterium]|nr:putative ABC transporter ATP-binding protein YadG [Candidatus Omnitrophota bacterium]